ncbi:MAG: hypothetical protein COC05_03365 [Gammaproteobacteria bacterium]|nr:MAG: hypothetical protein COC05_03365 [Gammaproteobacteria bacterium]
MKPSNAITLLLALCLLPAASTIAADTTIRVGGTGSSLSMMKILAAAYHESYPDMHVKVVPRLGSNGGMRALLAKKIDIAISALPLNKDARKAGAVQDEYARTPYTFTQHPDNPPLKSITTAQLANIFIGTTKNWTGGQVMRLVMRPLNDSDTLFMQNIAPEVNEAVKVALTRKGIIMAPTDRDSADALESISGAFGVSTLAQIKAEQRKLKPIALNGVMPSIQALESGQYKYYKSLSIVTRKNPDSATQRFIAYVRSQAGQQLLREYDHVVVPKQ